MRLVITGGAGNCGTALEALSGDTLFTDVRTPPREFSGNFRPLDITDYAAVSETLAGSSAVIHLAAASDAAAPWPEIMALNIDGARNVITAAAERGVDRVIYASSNRVVRMYELENAPQIYELGHGVMLDHHVPLRPDSEYGASKAFGETLGRRFAESGGPRFYALRIGSVRSAEEDHPYAYAEAGVRRGEWTRGSAEYRVQERRLKAIWQSRRDFLQMVELCLGYDGPRFDVFYGVSDNPGRWFDLEHARRELGYAPQDNAETFRQPPLVRT